MIKLSSSALGDLRIALQGVPFNCLFAMGVLDGVNDGQVWSDRAQEPTFAHIIHSYGMTLLVALSPDLDLAALAEHIDWCRQAVGSLWMQVYPHGLAPKLDRVLHADIAPLESAPNGVSIQRFTRCNFVFVPERYASMAPLRPIPQDFMLRRMTIEDFALPGIGVSPEHFWRNADEFIAQGGGWCVAKNAEVISIAFTSFRLGSQLEIGVETYPQHRGRGLAKFAATAIIDECVRSAIEPVWSCRKQNVPSYRFAQTLGFSPTVEGPYYHLPKISSQSRTAA